MAWGTTFKNLLDDDNVQPRLMLLVRPDSSPDWLPAGLQGELVLTNYDDTGVTNCIGDTCRVAGARLDLMTMRYTSAQLDVEILSATAIRSMIDYHLDNGYGARRGSIVELRVGLGTMDPADFETVFTGRLQNLSKSRGMGVASWRLTAYDIVTYCQTYRRPDIPSTGLLFREVGATAASATTIAATPYTVGDTTINVVDTSGFRMETGSSRGLLQIDNGTDAPFLLTYTGTTATTFTGCSTTGQFGTTAANAAVADAVNAAAWMQGHPINIARRMFVSIVGDNTNSSYDDYPEEWGLGIPSDYVDLSDMGDWVTATDSAAVWNLVALEGVRNPIRWLEDYLAIQGIFPAMRQGLITVRAVEDATASPTVSAPISLTDTWIADVTSWDLHDPAQPVEYTEITTMKDGSPFEITTGEQSLRDLYVRLRISEPWPGTASGGTTISTASGASATQPCAGGQIRDLSPMLWGPSSASGSNTEQAWTWLANIPERIGLRGRGLYWAQLCVGDRPTLTTALAFGATEAYDGGTGTYSSADVMVVAGPDVDWLHGGVDIEVVRYIDRTL